MAKKLDQKVSKLSLNADYFLHMLRDRKTEMYVKFAKVMVICQGPYTEERQKMAKKIQEIFKSSSRVLSDDTYRSEFKTSCSPDTTEEFYAYLKEEVKVALESGYNLIYIDTTLSNKEQNEYYIAAAQRMQYTVLVLPPVVTQKTNIMSWPKGSQAHSFTKQLKSHIEAPNMFKHLFCGWFLHDIDTEELRNECALYVNDLFEHIPDFSKWFSGGCKDKVTFSQYFNLLKEDVKKEKIVMREDLAFCAVKVFNNDFTMQEYFDKPVVREQYGRMSKLHIVGFVISPYMVAARVKLAHKQKDLWEMNDKVHENQDFKFEEPQFPSELYKSITELPSLNPQIKRICSKSNNTIVKAESVFDPTELIPPFAKGRSAHIVLGTSPNASPTDIDYGVAYALNREISASKQDGVEIGVDDIGKSKVKRIGKYWIVYLKDPLFVNGFFASCLKPKVYDTPLQAQRKLNG